MKNTLAILDFGSQFAHLLANRFRRLGVHAVLLPSDTPASDLHDYAAFVLSGGPASVNAPDAPRIDPEIYQMGKPILGICYGHQITMQTLGGQVDKGIVGEYGLTSFRVHHAEAHLKHLETREYTVYASHFDTVTRLPEGFVVLGSTEDDPYSASYHPQKKIFTLQFHPEVTHTEAGLDILQAFIEEAEIKRTWNMDRFIEEELARIPSLVQDKKVFMLISGGVDSSVAYTILAKALGTEKLYALYVDTGLMRDKESESIQTFLTEAGVKDLHVYHAGDRFLKALQGIYDPEEKRKIIGDMFLSIQKDVALELQLNPEEWLLGQGTIYPDTIESGGTKNADKIKTHHNRVPEIERLIEEGKIIEPLKELYKDEVRAVGRKLGLPDAMVDRHPFPGPGLGVRCLCSDQAHPLNENLDVDAELLDPQSWESTLLPVKSVGVQGDERSYKHPLALEWTRDISIIPNWKDLAILSTKLSNRYRSINRVILCLASQNPLKKMELFKADIHADRIALLQKADAMVMTAIQKLEAYQDIWQCPVVLLPMGSPDRPNSLVIRPVSSMEAMTANVTPLDLKAMQGLAQELLDQLPLEAVFYDLTNKPPGTIEWE